MSVSSKDSIIWLDVGKVHPNKYNPNVMMGEKFEALIDFCRTHGAEQLDPIWVRHDGVDGFEVVDGEHRWKAAKRVGWKRLRAFVIDLKEEDAKAFNVRKNRERGQLDAYKMGKLLYEIYKKEDLTHNGVGKKFGLSRRTVGEYIEVYENHEKIRSALKKGDMSPLPFRKSRDILRELKRQERGEPTENPQTPQTVEGTQNLEQFLTNYAEALKKNPLPKVEKDDVQTAIDFFKRVLKQKNVVCPVCGEKHLQWRCGHEF